MRSAVGVVSGGSLVVVRVGKAMVGVVKWCVVVDAVVVVERVIIVV